MKRYLEKLNVNPASAIIIGSIILGLSHLGYGYIVYSAQTNTNNEPFSVEKVAKEIKIKMSSWQACLGDANITKEVSDSINDGATAGVSGTPTTFVVVKKDNNYYVVSRIEGARDYNFIKTAVDNALSGTTTKELFKGKPINDTEFVRGKKDTVFLIEYADAECPFCVRFHPIINKIMDTYQDRVGYVYRNFPLTQIHQDAERRAVAIVCAGKVGGIDSYFKYINKLYEEAGR